jgi:hypothetical protein
VAVGGRFQRVDFASLSFKEQVETIRGTNILIGMHGVLSVLSSVAVSYSGQAPGCRICSSSRRKRL